MFDDISQSNPRRGSSSTIGEENDEASLAALHGMLADASLDEVRELVDGYSQRKESITIKIDEILGISGAGNATGSHNGVVGGLSDEESSDDEAESTTGDALDQVQNLIDSSCMISLAFTLFTSCSTKGFHSALPLRDSSVRSHMSYEAHRT